MEPVLQAGTRRHTGSSTEAIRRAAQMDFEARVCIGKLEGNIGSVKSGTRSDRVVKCVRMELCLTNNINGAEVFVDCFNPEYLPAS